MPWGDWQFWAVTLAAIVALVAVVRPLIPSRRKGPECPGCGPGQAAARPRRTRLTVSAKADEPPRRQP